ncbi:MAG: tRNA 2-selenouridine(34) synthase MnmH, partial [Burkholderiaceae bacterium]
MPIEQVEPAQALALPLRYHALIDARSPAEFALDALPGAINWPSLTNAEREQVGTLYVQVGAFEAKKLGAALVARNIAVHLEQHAAALPKDWQPLVYCWRGGNRSGALATVLGTIGFKVHVLRGGYKAFRGLVREQLSTLPLGLSWRVLAGPTGVGKTHVLHALQQQGAQVLDLEGLAQHRSSVLGLLPGTTQPSQKAFETRLWDTLRQLDRQRPVFVEAESKRVGNVTVPESLIAAMRQAPCVHLNLPMVQRVQLLMRDYAHFVHDVAPFCERLEALVSLCGRQRVTQWQQAARSGAVGEAVQSLLAEHYDPR